MSDQFLGRLLEDRHGARIPGCGKAIGDGREGCDPGPQAFQAGHPAFQRVYRIRPIELQVLEHSVGKRRRGRPPVDALADEPEHAAADPVTAAFIADRFAPSAHAIRPSGSVPGPGHRAGARQDENTGPSPECPDLGRIDIVEHALRNFAERGGDHLALICRDLFDFAIGRQSRGDTGEAPAAGEGSELCFKALSPGAIVDRVDSFAATDVDDPTRSVGKRDESLAAAAIDTEDQVVAHDCAPALTIVALTAISASRSRHAEGSPKSVTIRVAVSGATR